MTRIKLTHSLHGIWITVVIMANLAILLVGQLTRIAMALARSVWKEMGPQRYGS